MCVHVRMYVVTMDIHVHNARSIHDRAIVHALYIITQHLQCIVVCNPRKIIHSVYYSPHRKIHPAMPEEVYVCVCAYMCARIETGVRIKHACIENA